MGNIVTEPVHFAQHAASQNAEMWKFAAETFFAKQTSKKQALDLPPWKARGWAVLGMEGVRGMGKIDYKKVW